MDNEYDRGDLVKVTASFTDPSSADAAINPTAVNLTYKNPSGTLTSLTFSTGTTDITNSTTGSYFSNIDAALSGTYFYRWWSTGTAQAAEEKQFRVKPLNAST